MSLPTFDQFVAAFNNSAGYFRWIIFYVALIFAIVLAILAARDLAYASSSDNNGYARSALSKFVIASLLASFSWTIQVVSTTVYNTPSITAYVVPGGSSAEARVASVVIFLSLVIQIFGYGWFVQAMMRFNELSSPRGNGRSTFGGALMQAIGAVGCISIVYVVSLVQSFLGFQRTLADWLAPYGLS